MTESEALEILQGDDPDAVARAETALWEMWCQSGLAEVDALLQDGVRAIEAQDLARAESRFTRIIERAPEFAEGWNKRATVRYLAGQYELSVDDCREVIARKPHHFGALSGQGLCHMALGQHREAAAMFRRALEVHPHLATVRRNLSMALAEASKGNGHLPAEC
jgi:tetratricopeptide (TPR) repeat protein